MQVSAPRYRFLRAALLLCAPLALLLCALPMSATTFFVRTDGGTRTQCTGTTDAAYPGSGSAQPCAFNDLRYMWSPNDGTGGAGTWISSVGDTIVIRGCAALGTQVNPANPACRIGWDGQTGTHTLSNWCFGVGSYTCYNPTIPNNTTIEGACALTSCTPIDNHYPYDGTNEAQILCGFSLSSCFNLQGSSGVTIKGIEFTTHNQHWNGTAWSGNCTRGGSPAYPVACANNQPLDDYADNGLILDANTVNLTLQDVYIHGFAASGMFGPLGAGLTMTRVFSGFNFFAGWNMDNGSVPNGANASINASYVTMMGNGFYEEYPIVHTQFPARAGYDDGDGGFGDAWSGQSCTQSTQPNCVLVSFICDHCVSAYNTKDGYIGPHVPIETSIITNGQFYGNMGEQLKYGSTGSDISVGGTVLVQNNLVMGNCTRLASLIPGAAQNFALTTGLGGSYLSDFCRAGGNILQSLTQIGSTVSYYGNTFIFNGEDGMQFDCGPVGGGSTNCGSVPFVFKDNIFQGYTNPAFGAPSTLYEINSGTNIHVTPSYNLEDGLSGMDTCGVNGIVCANAGLVSQPATPWPGSDSGFDAFDWYPTSGSPAVHAGVAVSGLTTDFYGATRPNPPSIGAVEPAGTPTAATPTFSPVAGTYTGTQSVTISTSTGGATLCYTTDGTTPTANGAGTCTHGTTYSTAVSVASSLTLKAIASESGFLDSAVGSAAYTINPPPTPNVTFSGSMTISGSVTVQ